MNATRSISVTVGATKGIKSGWMMQMFVRAESQRWMGKRWGRVWTVERLDKEVSGRPRDEEAGVDGAEEVGEGEGLEAGKVPVPEIS